MTSKFSVQCFQKLEYSKTCRSLALQIVYLHFNVYKLYYASIINTRHMGRHSQVLGPDHTFTTTLYATLRDLFNKVI